LSVEILSEHVNALLGRREAKMVVHHEGSGTPDRLAIRKIASDHFKSQPERVYVRSVQTRTGGSSAICQVEVYDDPKLAERIVPAYVKNRNLPPGQRVSRKKGPEEEKPAPAAAAPKPAAPKPAAPEKKAEPAKPAPAKESKPAPAETKPPAKPEAKPAAKPPAKADAKPKL
jgi:ribosomal protein S24E